jgi:hypothetical protein
MPLTTDTCATDGWNKMCTYSAVVAWLTTVATVQQVGALGGPASAEQEW